MAGGDMTSLPLERDVRFASSLAKRGEPQDHSILKLKFIPLQ
jgi:hypothetical protein